MKVKKFIFGLFETNTYVASDEKGNALLIDPACMREYEQQALLRYIETEGLNVCAIVATHGHLDHLWGAKWATERWALPVLMHEADFPMAEAMQQQYAMFGIRKTADSFPIEPLNSQSSIFNLPSSIIETPGHTPGSICLYFPEEKTLFSGDTLFQNGFGRTDLPGGNMGQLICSLEHLFTLPNNVLVYPGHGEKTTIGAEKR
jgi:glyoxylase-like metal-dependent hydrolase (beta-lactamase superfamily II)